MDNINTSTISKVTLSCRVLPEQKLLIASRAKELGMSTSQYAEAKILQTDDVRLEREVIQLANESKLLEEKLAKAEKANEDFVEYFDHELMDFCTEYGHFEICGWEDPYGDTHPIKPLEKKEEIKEELTPKEEEKVVVTPPPPQPKSPPVKKPQYPTFPIYFESKKELKIFKKQIYFLARKYDLEDIDTAAIMSVGYTTENSKASFFLSTVKDFVKKYFK